MSDFAQPARLDPELIRYALNRLHRSSCSDQNVFPNLRKYMMAARHLAIENENMERPDDGKEKTLCSNRVAFSASTSCRT
jgi:hypothetical protein